MHFLCPTGRGILVLVLHLLCLALAFINQTIFTLVLACICLALLAASLLCALFCLHGISLQRLPAEDAQVGRALDIPIRLRNRCPWKSQALIVFEQLPFTADPWHRQIAGPLAAHQEIQVARTTLPARRGNWTLRKIILRSGDPAGLFRREKVFNLPQEILVLPAPAPLPDLRLEEAAATALAANRTLSRIGASQEFYGIREYKTTDGVRFINWRATAKHRKLMVTEFEHTAYAAVALLLDAPRAFAGSGDESNLEYQISVAAAIVSQCANRFCSLAFAAGGDRELLHLPKEATDLKQTLLRDLALLKPGDIPLETALAKLAPALAPHTLVFCLSLDENPALTLHLTGLAQAAMDVHWSCARLQDFPRKKTPQSDLLTITRL